MRTSDIADWDQIAPSYAAQVGTPEDRIYRQFKDVLWDCLGDLRHRSVLDLGCGHGWLARLLAQAGAGVCAVDGSEELLKLARKAAPGVTFLRHDLSQGLPRFDRPFDRVIAHMVLMDLPEIDPVPGALRALLKPDGKFVFTMPHPCFFNSRSGQDPVTGEPFRMIKGYLRPEVWRLDSFGGHNHYHRSLTYYFEALRQHGFVVARLYEPEHIPRSAVTQEEHEFGRNIPVFLLIEAVPRDREPGTGR